MTSGHFLITVTNPGYRTVTLTGGAGIVLPDGKEHTILNLDSNAHFPHQLAEGESCLLWTDIAELAQQLKQQMGLGGEIALRAFVDSALGTRYRSKKSKFDVEAWAR